MLGGLILGVLIGLAIGTLVGAIILRAGVSLYNKLASDEGVPEPEMGKAMGITFVTTLANFVAGFVIGFVFVAAAGRRGSPLAPQLFSLPVSFLIMAAMLTGMLPTTFGKACLVTLCYLIIALLIFGGIFLIVMLVGLLL